MRRCRILFCPVMSGFPLCAYTTTNVRALPRALIQGVYPFPPTASCCQEEVWKDWSGKEMSARLSLCWHTPMGASKPISSYSVSLCLSSWQV